jgi:hypothetical protein
MAEAASTSETSVNFYETTRRNNPEDSYLQLNNCLSHRVNTVLRKELKRFKYFVLD